MGYNRGSKKVHVQLPFAHAFWISRFLFSIIEPKTESDFSENSEQYYCHYYGCDIFIGSCQKSKEVVLSREGGQQQHPQQRHCQIQRCQQSHRWGLERMLSFGVDISSVWPSSWKSVLLGQKVCACHDPEECTNHRTTEKWACLVWRKERRRALRSYQQSLAQCSDADWRENRFHVGHARQRSIPGRFTKRVS